MITLLDGALFHSGSMFVISLYCAVTGSDHSAIKISFMNIEQE